jgi:hypothetical protein
LPEYKGEWSRIEGSPDCVYRKGYHSAKPKNKNRATFEFEGNRVRVWYISHSNAGQAEVRIDGQLVDTIVMTGSDPATCRSWNSGELEYAPHTIELRPVSGVNGRISLDVLTITQ